MRSEKELEQQRDMLEIKVRERTDELWRTQFEKIERINRFAEIGQLSSGLLHDVFNLLNAISLRLEDSSDTSLAEAFNTTKQIDNFTQAIRKQLDHRNHPEKFSLTQSIEQVIQLLSYKATKANVQMIIKSDGGPEIDHFDAPFKFQQILLNLLLNAIESFDELDAEDHRERTVSVDIRQDDGMIILSVEDNGTGIPSEIQTKIFDQFFTTKDSSKDIGIGLATIKKIVEEEFLGRIILDSEVFVGSRFTIIFHQNMNQHQEILTKAINHMKKHQLPDGSFLSLSSIDRNNFPECSPKP